MRRVFQFTVRPKVSLGGPPLIGDMPNPSAHWDFFFDEGTLQKVELSPAPKHQDVWWLITCHIVAKGASIEITMNIPGTRSCQISPNSGGSIISQRDGSELCLGDHCHGQAIHPR